MQCIYCKNTIDDSNRSEEHVFPQSFGCPDTWVIDCVCRDCNNQFGGDIERKLAGDSIEGIWRLQKRGSRSKKPIRQTRIRMHIVDNPRAGAWSGLRVFADFTKKESLYIPPQVITRGGVGEKKVYLINDITDDEIKKIQGNIILFTNNSVEHGPALDRLKRLGMTMDDEPIKWSPCPINSDGKLDVKIEARIDTFILRAIAKIAFNYLAKVRGPIYALNPQFDDVRKYIRGEKDLNLVTRKTGHILANETLDWGFFEGHLFTLETEGNRLISKVSISNAFDFYYVVDLGYSLIWQREGHAYSVKENSMLPLHAKIEMRRKPF